MATKAVRLVNIAWDMEDDGERVILDVPLPSEMSVNVSADEDEWQDVNFIHELAMDAASDKTGWCILSSELEIGG